MSDFARPSGQARTRALVRALSEDFPTDGGDTTLNGFIDAFVTKFQEDGTLVWSTFFGGNDRDLGLAIAGDGISGVYVTGQTSSSDLPTTNGWDTTYNDPPFEFGLGDAFAAKFSTNGSLMWSTYLGGTSNDVGRGPELWSGRGIAADNTAVYVVGGTESDDFPRESGWDTVLGGFADGFVTKFDSDGLLLWSTYLGGSETKSCAAAAWDGEGNVCVGGDTDSSDFPASGGYDESYNSGGDCFVATFDSDGAFRWSTYVGGSSEDYPMGIAIGGSNSVCITGGTLSTNYAAVIDDGAAVVLRALATAVGEYSFVKWELNGKSQTAGSTTLRFSINSDSAAVARYKQFRSLKILGTKVMNEGSSARYVCRLYCRDGTYYNITRYARWSDNSRYARIYSTSLLRTYSVPADRRVRLTATYAGRTVNLYITVRNVR